MKELAFVLVFYWGFAAAISVYRLWLKGTLNTWNKVLYAPLLLLFGAVDVTLNYTVLIVTMGLPPAGCYTISARMDYYHHFPCGWKTTVATFVCERLLNTIDPSGNHC